MDRSNYINDLDFQSNQNQVQLPYDNYDYNQPAFPHTPSYNGSYNGSPYSGHSELSLNGDEFALFDDEATRLTLQREDYDPNEYDAPNNSGLLMFENPYLGNMENNQVSLSVTAPVDHRSPIYDYSSPSSNGGAESGNENEQRSRASSISSQHVSPRLDVQNSFENMRFESPHWGSNPLPIDPQMSPPHKAQSPPQLMIPDHPSPASSYDPEPPIVLTPANNEGLLGGPQLHIVPATPVSGPGPAQTVSYQQSLETLHQGSSLRQSWTAQTQQMPGEDDSRGLGMQNYREQAAQQSSPFSFPQHSHNPADSGLSTSTAHLNSSNSNNDSNNTLYLFPVHTRGRSKSDTALQPPIWNTGFMGQTHNQGSANDDRAATVNLNDVLPPLDHQSSFNNISQPQPPHLTHSYTYGPPSSSNQLSLSDQFLSPDMSTSIRRSKSDAGSSTGRPGHRHSRSEDTRHSAALLFPPSSQQEFINRQFLHPSEPIQSIRGHFRRASSGSRVERPGIHGHWSNGSSARASPYISPSASPRVRYDDLPDEGLPNGMQQPMNQGMGMGQECLDDGSALVSKPNVTTGRTANASHKRRKQDANFMCPVPGCGSTFTRSFNLKGHLRSHNEEKPFQCKWPGCGKGFARQHDCKRHEQLHSNYRPFVCDGCNKPFARMDALNRHLKSEGGADCQRILAENGGGTNGSINGRSSRSPPLPAPKLEYETDSGGFNSVGVML